MCKTDKKVLLKGFLELSELGVDSLEVAGEIAGLTDVDQLVYGILDRSHL